MAENKGILSSFILVHFILWLRIKV